MKEILSRKLSQSTGSFISIFRIDKNSYAIVCETHGRGMHVETVKLAFNFSSQPGHFCNICKDIEKRKKKLAKSRKNEIYHE